MESALGQLRTAVVALELRPPASGAENSMQNTLQVREQHTHFGELLVSFLAAGCCSLSILAVQAAQRIRQTCNLRRCMPAMAGH